MARKLITHARIVESALFCAFKNGMGALTLADIAHNLQIKKASLYNYFSGKDELVLAVYEYARDFYSRIEFLGQKFYEKISKESAPDFEKIFGCAAKDFASAHEREPLFQIYALVASEKYFNKKCLEIFLQQKTKVREQCFDFFKFVFCKKNSASENFAQQSFEKLKFYSKIFCESFFSLLDFYLAQKKELVRKNPECDAGSLFALPSDNEGLEKIADFAKEILRKII